MLPRQNKSSERLSLLKTYWPSCALSTPKRVVEAEADTITVDSRQECISLDMGRIRLRADSKVQVKDKGRARGRGKDKTRMPDIT